MLDCQVASVAVFQDEVDVVIILKSFVQLNDVGAVHFLHALDFAFEILLEVGMLLNFILGNQLHSVFFALFILHQVDVSECSFPEFALVGVLLKKHNLYLPQLNIFTPTITRL